MAKTVLRNDIDRFKCQRPFWEMASTVLNGKDCSEKWHRPFQIASTVLKNDINRFKWQRPFWEMTPTVLNGNDRSEKWHRSFQIASTVLNGIDRSEKWHRPFQMATTVLRDGIHRLRNRNLRLRQSWFKRSVFCNDFRALNPHCKHQRLLQECNTIRTETSVFIYFFLKLLHHFSVPANHGHLWFQHRLVRCAFRFTGKSYTAGLLRKQRAIQYEHRQGGLRELPARKRPDVHTRIWKKDKRWRQPEGSDNGEMLSTFKTASGEAFHNTICRLGDEFQEVRSKLNQ